MARGRKAATQPGREVTGDNSAEAFFDNDEFADRLSAQDTEQLTGGFGPATRGARSGELQFADIDG